jgi:hypothetical protein
MPKKRYNAVCARWSATGSWNRSLRFQRLLNDSRLEISRFKCVRLISAGVSRYSRPGREVTSGR